MNIAICDDSIKDCDRVKGILVKEATTLDPDVLSKVKGEQLMILEASEAKGLAEAVPVALARLEYKLANIGE